MEGKKNKIIRNCHCAKSIRICRLDPETHLAIFFFKKKGDKTLDSASMLIHWSKLIKMGKPYEYKLWRSNMGLKIEI